MDAKVANNRVEVSIQSSMKVGQSVSCLFGGPDQRSTGKHGVEREHKWQQNRPRMGQRGSFLLLGSS